MRSFKLFLGIIILSIFTFSACNENTTNPESVSNNNKSLAKDPAELQQIITYMQQNNIEHAAFFYDVTDLGSGLGIVDVPNQKAAFFYGNFGPGDFLRMNPDGTYSFKLVTNQADATFFDFVSPQPYFGTGHMNYKWSGTGYDIIPGLGILMFPDASLNAAVMQGHATVTLGGSGEDPHTVHMNYVTNPGGGGYLKVTFN
jgi:hypothetical protein